MKVVRRVRRVLIRAWRLTIAASQSLRKTAAEAMAVTTKYPAVSPYLVRDMSAGGRCVSERIANSHRGTPTHPHAKPKRAPEAHEIEVGDESKDVS